MKNLKILFTSIFLTILITSASAQEPFGSDIIKTSEGDLKVVFLGHGSLMFEFDGKAIYADPVGGSVNWSKMPKADLVLITHEHGDHLNVGVLDRIRKSSTAFVMNRSSAKIYKADNIAVMKNGEEGEAAGFIIEAVPAYNKKNRQFHPKGRDNGYVVTFGDKRLYIGGDTEYIPEMGDLKNIDIAFLPMNIPYTMTIEMMVKAAEAFKPKILYPYHYRGSDMEKLASKMKKVIGVELRVRTIY